MLKLNVGFNRKTGEANFGSRGASVNVELELDSSLIGDGDRLRERIRQLFGMAKASVDEELALIGHSATNGKDVGGHAATPINGNGHATAPANGRRRDGTRWATASQVRALNAIAERRQINLQALLLERFQIHEPAGLTITEASSLIDELKADAASNGQGGRR